MGAPSNRLFTRGVPGAAVTALLWLVGGGAARAEPGRAAPAAYEENAFLIVHLGKHADAVDEKGSSWRPVQGLVYRFSLDPPEFLEAVGRSDLADHERTRHRRARALSIVGDIIAPIGLLTALWGLGVSGGRVALVGLGGLIGGVVIHETGESMLDPALPESQALQLADSYNRALRARLGLPPLDPPPPPPRAKPSQFRPSAVTSGGTRLGRN